MALCKFESGEANIKYLREQSDFHIVHFYSSPRKYEDEQR